MSWTITFDFQDGSGARDITNLVMLTSLERKTQIHNNLKPVVNSCSFKIAWDPTIINLLLTGTSDVMVTIDKDTVPWFTGTVRKNFSGRVKTARRENFKIEIVDLGETLLKKKIGVTSALANYKVSDTVNTSASIVHYLLTRAGLSSGNILPDNIPTTIDYFVNVEGEGTYWERLEKLLFEMGYVFYFDYSGNFKTYDLFPLSLTTANELNSSNNLTGSLGINKKPEQFEGVDLKWWVHELLLNVPVFNDTTGGDDTNPCNIDVPSAGYYPAGAADHPVYSEYKVDDRELIVALNTDLSTGVVMEAGLALVTATDYFKRARLEAYNSAAVSKKITSFKIFGDAVVKGDMTITKVLNVIDTDKKKTIEAEYITESSTALRLASGLAQFYKYSDFLYICKSQTEYASGDIVQIVDSISGINLTARVVSRKDTGHISDILYVLEGVAEYAAQTIVEEGVHTQPPALPPGSGASLTEGLPTYLELDEGYTSTTGGTTVPTIPVLNCESAYKSIILKLDKQTNLRWLKDYEFQVSNDGSTWYSLKFDGTDWKDTLGATTAWPTEQLVHSRIPSDLTNPDDPQPRLLFYRVRRVTVQNVASDWSTTVTGTTSLVETGDIPANTITANMITTTFLQAAFVNITGSITIGFQGSGTTDNPNEGDRRVYIDGDEIGFEEYTNGAWSTVNSIKLGGADSNGNFAPFLSCRGVVNPLASEVNAEVIPNNASRIINFENTSADQFGVLADTVTDISYSTVWKKFGTYSGFTPFSGASQITAVMGWNDDIDFTKTMGAGAWFYVGKSAGTGAISLVEFMRFNDNNNNVRIFLGTAINNTDSTVFLKGYISITVGGVVTSYVVNGGTLCPQWPSPWNVEFYGAIVWDASTLTLSVITNNNIASVTLPSAVNQPSVTTSKSFSFYTKNDNYVEQYVDEGSFFVNDNVNPDLFAQHYNHNVPWNMDASAKDLILKPAAGGKVIIDGEIDTGAKVYSITSFGYSNGWVAYDEGGFKPKIVVKNNVCYMSGLIKPGTINNIAFTLPPELRPSTNQYCSTINGTSPYTAYLLSIMTNGTVRPYGVAGAYRSLKATWVIGE